MKDVRKNMTMEWKAAIENEKLKSDDNSNAEVVLDY